LFTAPSAPVSKDTDAKRVKQGARVYLGYTLHACSDAEGYIDWRVIIPANGPANGQALTEAGLKDSVMYKAQKHRPLTVGERCINQAITQYCYVIEQRFGTLK
jgi:transposase, IS5 family